MTIWNSLYFYNVNVIEQVTKVTTHRIYDATHYNSMVFQLQLC
jgi:hypothetical protein